MAFHEIRFPATLSFGSLGGPERRTEVVTLANGHEERNTPWAQARRRYDAGLGLRSLDDVEVLIAFFEARQAMLHGFRWKDWADHKTCRASREVSALDQSMGNGDGAATAFQLIKSYTSGAWASTRVITKPVAGTLRVAIAGVEVQEGMDWQVDGASGILTFTTPPAVGAEITAGFEFDVPVRFDTDLIQVSVASFQAGDVPKVPVIEVRA
ncbi:TIGR02217 family protein [Pararhodobacter oceanensis]|uniref:phage distal tail protein, Rcc01695 family n=1 Tax=Pararhodobacter oceanensis TaxID=2172121 RepID=UPI003A90224A